MGASDIELTDYGVVYATIPATIPHAEKIPTIAYFAHVDTSPAVSGANVKPLIHHNYDGSPIVLPGNTDLVINSENSPYIAQRIGETIITSDGTTLLGADDKAGVAIIMSLAAHLLANPDIPHGRIRLAFTPDEEIGRGVSNIKLEHVAADVAYTLDGSVRGEVVFETFSADKAVALIDNPPITPSLAVDAACSGNPGTLEYRGVDTETKQQHFHQGPFPEGTNNIGEFLAIVHGLALLKRQNSDIPIYSDSKIAINWVKAKWCRTNLDQTENNTELFTLIDRAEQWLKNNTYPNKILKWDTPLWGEIPADFGRK